MTFHFGHPDLMIKLIFNNSWLDVTRIRTISQLALTQKESDLDMRLQPYDSMTIWRNKISWLSQTSWQDLIDALGFGTISHFCERLEFQTRGAPDKHLLLWLNDTLSLCHLKQSEKLLWKNSHNLVIFIISSAPIWCTNVSRDTNHQDRLNATSISQNTLRTSSFKTKKALFSINDLQEPIILLSIHRDYYFFAKDMCIFRFSKPQRSQTSFLNQAFTY
jgi:hypothetical protein